MKKILFFILFSFNLYSMLELSVGPYYGFSFIKENRDFSKHPNLKDFKLQPSLSFIHTIGLDSKLYWGNDLIGFFGDISAFFVVSSQFNINNKIFDIKLKDASWQILSFNAIFGLAFNIAMRNYISLKLASGIKLTPLVGEYKKKKVLINSLLQLGANFQFYFSLPILYNVLFIQLGTSISYDFVNFTKIKQELNYKYNWGITISPIINIAFLF